MAFTRANAREMGSRGGRATVDAHGREHMQAIGRAGFIGLAKSLGFKRGYRSAAVRKLQEMGRLRVPARVQAETARYDQDLAALESELFF